MGIQACIGFCVCVCGVHLTKQAWANSGSSLSRDMKSDTHDNIQVAKGTSKLLGIGSLVLFLIMIIITTVGSIMAIP